MKASQLKDKYLSFFAKRGHAIIPSAPLVPEHDPTTLFISAGMHPLVPYLLGEPHPQGKRLANVQKCLRTKDIEKVGNTTHHTFFEMLGNWSLGDYWKEEAISWSWEFLTGELSLDPKRISVSVFAGDRDAPRDEESAKVWQELGIPKSRIYYFPKENNWWGPVGETGPCGPDTEMFYDTTGKPHGPDCAPEDGCGRYFEIWNDVFMQYEKKDDGTFVPLKQKNVDTGMGVERTVAVLQGRDDNYQTELFQEIITLINRIGQKDYRGKDKMAMRIIADHLRAATFVLADGVTPSNVEQGYVLRRLVRRAIRHGQDLGIKGPFTREIAGEVIKTYKEAYPELEKAQKSIVRELSEEEARFAKTLTRGLKEFEKLVKSGEIATKKTIPGKEAFVLYETYGFPLELTEEMAAERGLKVEKSGFEKAAEEHQKRSREATVGRFAGGLADHSEEVTKMHTATHLLHAALRQVLGRHVTQVGSNITRERLRFDFSHPKAMTAEEIKAVEDLVNQKIKEDLPVSFRVTSFDEAIKEGALAFFGEKYGPQVKVYKIGNFSKEVCGGPHVSSTGKIGGVKIIKEKPVGAGKRRLYAQLA